MPMRSCHRQRNDCDSDGWKESDGNNIATWTVAHQRDQPGARLGPIYVDSGKITAGTGVDSLQQRRSPGLRVSERSRNRSRTNRRGRCYIPLRELRLRRFGGDRSGWQPPVAGTWKRERLFFAGPEDPCETAHHSTGFFGAGAGRRFTRYDPNRYGPTGQRSHA